MFVGKLNVNLELSCIHLRDLIWALVGSNCHPFFTEFGLLNCFEVLGKGGGDAGES